MNGYLLSLGRWHPISNAVKFHLWRGRTETQSIIGVTEAFGQRPVVNFGWYGSETAETAAARTRLGRVAL